MYESVTHFVPQHATVEARCRAAGLLAAELEKLDAPRDLPICVDTLSNAASLAYGALPERLVPPLARAHRGRLPARRA